MIATITIYMQTDFSIYRSYNLLYITLNRGIVKYGRKCFCESQILAVDIKWLKQWSP